MTTRSSSEESGAAESNHSDAPAPADEPILVTTAEMVVSIAILALMASAMGYVVWIVVRYWNRVGV